MQQLSLYALVFAVASLLLSACAPEESSTRNSQPPVETSTSEAARPLYPWAMPKTDHPGHVVLNNHSYDVCYSTTLHSPLWAAYYYYADPDSDFDRLGDFFEDRRLEEGLVSSPDDFDGIFKSDWTGFDQGHVAPHENLEQFGGVAIEESYRVTNITPQYTRFNRVFWRVLEEKTRDWAGDDDTVWVVTGPVFYEGVEVKRAKPAERVPIPHAYFQAIVRMNRSEEGDAPETQAFLVPHSVDGYDWDDAQSVLVAIDDIEEVTDLDLFPELPEELESEPGTPWWPVGD